MQAIAAVAIAAACGGASKSDSVAGETAASTSPTVYSSPSPRPVVRNYPPGCPATGRWALCSIEKRLRSAGLVARKKQGEAALRAGFTVKPEVYALGRDSRLELFIYPDEAALSRDVAKLDTVAVAPRGERGTWGSAPVLIRSANLAAVLLTRDPREADRLSLALTAGAPQPAR